MVDMLYSKNIKYYLENEAGSLSWVKLVEFVTK